jgi:hypothetical protein
MEERMGHVLHRVEAIPQRGLMVAYGDVLRGAPSIYWHGLEPFVEFKAWPPWPWEK